MPSGKKDASRRPPQGGKGGGPRSTIRHGLSTLKNIDVREPVRRQQQQQGSGGRAAPGSKTDTATKLALAARHDWGEWRGIYESLWHGEDAASIAAAKNGLVLWQHRAMARREPQLFPPYAAATLEVATVVLADDGRVAEDVLVHAYVGAITRAVVELTDRGASGKAKATSSYRERAQAVSLPTEVTEVRNMASHGHTPPLAQLRWVAAVVLTHVRTEFWDVQFNDLQSVEEHQEAVKESEKVAARERLLAAVDRAADKGTTGSSAAGASAALSLEELRSRLTSVAKKEPTSPVPAGRVETPGEPADTRSRPAPEPITTWT